MYIKVDRSERVQTRPIKATCFNCGRDGTFDALTEDLQLWTSGAVAKYVIAGHRKCPNDECRAHVFFILDSQGKLNATFPAETIDFDASNIPTAITSIFKEAILCHSVKCYTASAMMIRRSLEEICADKKAAGNNLKERIKALRNDIVLPKELLEGMDELRLLGNDAAHIEAKDFDEVGPEEVAVGIEFAKEILKATYQYSHLLQRLRALKKK